MLGARARLDSDTEQCNGLACEAGQSASGAKFTWQLG